MSEWQEVNPVPAVVEKTPPQDLPFWTYRDLVFFLAAALPSLLLAGLIVRGLFEALSWSGRSKALELLPAQFLGYGIWFVCLYVLLRLKYGRPFWRSLGWVRPADRFWQRAMSGVALAFVVVAAGVLLRTPDLDMPIKQLLTDRSSLLLVGISAATFGPLFEELAFRGFLLPLLVRSLGAFAGILLSALPFALLHGPQYAWSWRHLLLITIAGAAFGWMRYRSDSTAASTVMHAAYNVTFFVAFVVHGKGLPAEW